jgi:hypothetical protein
MRKSWAVAALLATAVTASGGEAYAEDPGSREPRRAAGWMIIGIGGGLGVGTAATGAALMSTGKSANYELGSATLVGGAATVAVSLLIGVPLVLLSDPEKRGRKTSGAALARALNGQISW